MHKLFVYGTLRQEAEDPTLYYAPGTALFNLGRFPAAAESRYFGVVGQIMEVDDDRLAMFDRYEGVEAGFYTREKTICLRKDGEPGSVEAWIYMAGDDIIRYIEEKRRRGYRLRIQSGDWDDAHAVADFVAKI